MVRVRCGAVWAGGGLASLKSSTKSSNLENSSASGRPVSPAIVGSRILPCMRMHARVHAHARTRACVHACMVACVAWERHAEKTQLRWLAGDRTANIYPDCLYTCPDMHELRAEEVERDAASDGRVNIAEDECVALVAHIP